MAIKVIADMPGTQDSDTGLLTRSHSLPPLKVLSGVLHVDEGTTSVVTQGEMENGPGVQMQDLARSSSSKQAAVDSSGNLILDQFQENPSHIVDETARGKDDHHYSKPIPWIHGSFDLVQADPKYDVITVCGSGATHTEGKFHHWYHRLLKLH